jgi:predicted cupin superfamily sugar epimerase
MTPDSPARAEYWRRALHLEPLPVESGWWAARSRSDLPVTEGEGTLAAHNSIYYLLDPERPVNYWHRLASDDIHVLIEGGPVEYLLATDAGAIERHVLGRDVDAGEQPMVVCPAGTTKALRLIDPQGYALIGSVVTPGWAPDRVSFTAPLIPGEKRPAWLEPGTIAALTSPDTA